MNKHLKISVALLSSIFVLVACGQNNSASSATETTQAAEATTTAPTSNKQNTTEDLPKDGVQRFKHVDKGGSTFLIYYFKDDIVYKQIGIYFYNPKGLGKSEEEVIPVTSL